MSVFAAYTFYTKAHAHRKKLLVALACLWLALGVALMHLPIEKSSAAFFPDNTKELRSMVRGMDAMLMSKHIYVDFSFHSSEKTHAPHDLEALANHIRQVEKSLDTNIVTVEKETSPTSLMHPKDIISLIPSLFSSAMEKDFIQRIQKPYVQQKLQEIQTLLLGFPSGAMIPWLRQDPLQWRDALLPLLPKGQGFPTPDSRYGYALSHDGKHLLLILSPMASVHQTESAVKVMEHLEQSLQKLPSNVHTKIVGGLRHTAANTKAIDGDIFWISLVSLLGIALIYVLFIRSKGGIWLLLTPCFAVSIALGLVHVYFGVVSGLALGFGMAILGIAEDYAVHMHFALRSSTNKKNVFAALSTPLFQGFLLNASGFALLVFSAIPAVRQLSVFAIAALGSGFLLALYILPLCPGFDLPIITQKKETQNAHKALPQLWPTLGLSCTLGAMCIYFFMLLPIDVSPRSMGAQMQEIQQDSTEFNKIWGTNTSSLILIDAQNSQTALAHTAKVQEELQKALPQMSFTSLASILQNTETTQENITRWQEFLQKHATQIREHISAVPMAVDSNIFFAPFIDFLQSPARTIDLAFIQQSPFKDLIPIFLQDNAKHSSTRVQSRIVAEGTITPQQLPATIADTVTLLSPAGLEEQLRSAFFAEARYIPFMFLCCLILLFVCFKNIGQTLLAALPATAALFCIFLTMYICQKPLTLAGLAAMPLVLGLSIDHGIMATHHLAKGMALHMDRAITVSSLTGLVSMGMLAFTTHPALQAMGLVVFVGLLVELPVSLWLLPKLCKENT